MYARALDHSVREAAAWVGDEHIVDVHVAHVRRKLGDDPSQPSLITTVRGHGLRFELDPPGSSDVLRSSEPAAARTA